jgi:hypothetical protein
MTKKSAYRNHMLGFALLLLLVPAASFAQEGYYGATDTSTLGNQPSLPVLAARIDPYPGAGDGYYGAQQPSDTCAQSQQLTVGQTSHLVFVSATAHFADQDAGISTCGVPRSNSIHLRPDPSASQNRVEYGGGGM